MGGNKSASDLDEEEIAKCVKQMATMLHELITEGADTDAIFGALNMRFAEMLSARSNQQPVTVDAQALYPTLSQNQWTQIEHSHLRMKSVCEALRGEGLSEDSIIASLIIGVRNILRMSGMATDMIDKTVADLLNQFLAVRRPQVIRL